MTVFDDELQHLKERLLRMGSLVEDAIKNSIIALVDRDNALAQLVIDNDRLVNTLDVEIDEESIRLIALRQPNQQHLEGAGIDTRMVWTGNATRQPAFRGIPMRIDHGGLANADRVMEHGLILPMNHALGDAHMHYIADRVEAFVR